MAIFGEGSNRRGRRSFTNISRIKLKLATTIPYPLAAMEHWHSSFSATAAIATALSLSTSSSLAAGPCIQDTFDSSTENIVILLVFNRDR